MPTPEAFDLPPAYRAAVEAIRSMIDNGEATLLMKDLPEGPCSKLGLENYAREYCKVNPNYDLAMVYGICGVSTCVAAQGAYSLVVPIAGGGWLTVPAIQMVLGVAPSGWGKSTALDVGMKPLLRALKAALAERRRMLPILKQDAMDAWVRANPGSTLVPDVDQFKAVYDAGLCPKTLTSDPTQEALRNQAVANGGHVGCMAGEPDFFRNISAWSKDGGSLTLPLNMWDQREIDTTRVSNTELQIDEASLALCVLFQTEVFAEITSGNMRGMGAGADSYVARGVFGRMWVVDTELVGDLTEIAKSYSDDMDFDNDHADPDGYANADGTLTPLGSAAIDFEQALHEVALDSNLYRVSKAIHRSWDVTATRYGTDMMVIEPPVVPREVLHLDTDGLLAYRRVQRMMQEILQHIRDSSDDDMQTLWNPMAARIVQHVLREALVIALASGKTPYTITAEYIEDAATRILPWRWAHTASALTRRAIERAEDIMAEAVITLNPQKVDMTPTAMIANILGLLAAEDRTLITPGLPLTKLREKVRARLPRKHRTSVSTLLESTLKVLTADPVSGITLVQAPSNARDPGLMYYRVAPKVNFP